MRRRLMHEPAHERADHADRMRRFAPLATARLELVALSLSDADAVFDYAGDADIARRLGCTVHRTPADSRRWIAGVLVGYARGGYFEWAIRRRADGVMLGTCGFSQLDRGRRTGEISYVVRPAYTGSGYGTEAARAVVRFGVERLCLQRIHARCLRDNGPSRRVLDKLGFCPIEVGESRDDAPADEQLWALAPATAR